MSVCLLVTKYKMYVRSSDSAAKQEPILKATPCFFFLLPSTQNHFYDSLACNGEKGTAATDTAHLVGLLEDDITLVTCPTPSQDNAPHFTLCTPTSTPLACL